MSEDNVTNKKNRRSLKTGILYSLVACLTILLIIAAIIISNHSTQMYEKNREIALLTEKYDSVQRQYDTVNAEYEKIKKRSTELQDSVLSYISKYSDLYTFLNNHVVIINSGSNYYHKFGCNNLDMSYFYVTNPESAIWQGYWACECINRDMDE